MRLERNYRIPGACSIFTEACGNGVMIGTDPTLAGVPPIPKDPRLDGTACSAAAVGAVRGGDAGRRFVRPTRRAKPVMSVFESCSLPFRRDKTVYWQL